MFLHNRNIVGLYEKLEESGVNKGYANISDLSAGEYRVKVFPSDYSFAAVPAYEHNQLITIIPTTVSSMSTSTPLSSGMLVYCSFYRLITIMLLVFDLCTL